MAFVRWRGTCAELLATVYENGRSHQILLANLTGFYASVGLRQQVAHEHPDIPVNWLAVDRALARGPKTAPTPEPPLTILQAETLLRGIALQLMSDDRMTRDAGILMDAADILFGLRADPRLVDCLQSAILSSDDDPHSEEPLRSSDLSSDDGARPPPPGGQPGRGPKPPRSRTLLVPHEYPLVPGPRPAPPGRLRWPNFSGFSGSFFSGLGGRRYRNAQSSVSGSPSPAERMAFSIARAVLEPCSLDALLCPLVAALVLASASDMISFFRVWM